MPIHADGRRPRALALLAVWALALGLLAAPARAFSSGEDADLVLGHARFAEGAATARQVSNPGGVAVDPVTGGVFVADSGNNRVLRFASLASLSRGAPADGVLGQPDFASYVYGAAPQQMWTPAGVAVDSAGRLWVADTRNNRVLRFDAAADKPNGAPADGVLGQPDFASKALAITARGMFWPLGVALDSAGRLWVADSQSSRVLRFDTAASKPNGAPADGVLGQPIFTSSTRTALAQGMFEPAGVAVDSAGRLWVADTWNNRVLRFDAAADKPNGAPADGVLGQRDFTINNPMITRQGMDRPFGVAVDSDGRLWVADAWNHRVLRFDHAASDPKGAPADGVLGQPDFTSNTFAVAAQRMKRPRGLAVDGSGRLWVADSENNRVLRFDAAAFQPDGDAADGVLGNTSLSAAWLISSDVLHLPRAVAVDPTTGKVFVADMANHRVLRFAASTGLRSGAAAEAVLGQLDFATNTPATSAQGMNAPISVAVDGSGRLWVADRENSRVLRFDAAASKPTGAPADGVLGQADFAGNAEATTAEGMQRPSGVALDGDGRLWVADQYNSRVLRFDAAAGKPNGAPADGVLGQADFTTSTYTTTARGMFWPSGVALDGEGRLWVADGNNSRVLRFDAAAGKPNGAAADGVLGQAGFTSDARTTTAQGMSFPSGVALDGGGRLWVADTGNNRVLWFDAAASRPTGAPADGVLGQANLTSSTPATTAQGMSSPAGVALDGGGRLWVADTWNHRALLFDPFAPVLRPQIYLPMARR